MRLRLAALCLVLAVTSVGIRGFWSLNGDGPRGGVSGASAGASESEGGSRGRGQGFAAAVAAAADSDEYGEGSERDKQQRPTASAPESVAEECYRSGQAKRQRCSQREVAVGVPQRCGLGAGLEGRGCGDRVGAVRRHRTRRDGAGRTGWRSAAGERGRLIEASGGRNRKGGRGAAALGDGAGGG